MGYLSNAVRFTTPKSGPITGDSYKFYLTQRTRFPSHLIEKYVKEAEQHEKKSKFKSAAVSWDIVEEVGVGLQTRRENLQRKYDDVVETRLDNTDFKTIEEQVKEKKDRFLIPQEYYDYVEQEWDRSENYYSDTNTDSDWY